MEAKRCSVCLEEVQTESQVYLGNCGHFLCKECFESWSTLKNICPVCKATFFTTSTVDPGSSQSRTMLFVFDPPKAVPAAESSVEMLDHSYFLSEIEVILALVDSLRTSLFQQRGHNKGTPAEWKILEHTKTQLINLQSYFRLMNHFEPKDYIDLLGDAYKGLDSVRTHNRIAQEQYLLAHGITGNVGLEEGQYAGEEELDEDIMDEYEEELACLAKFGLKHTAKPGGRIPSKMLPSVPKPIVKETTKKEVVTKPKEDHKEDAKVDIIRPRNNGTAPKKNKKRKKGVTIKI